MNKSISYLLIPSLVLSLLVFPDFVSEVNAASSASTQRMIKKMKKKIRSLKRNLLIAQNKLKAPPFVEFVSVGNANNAADSSGKGSVSFTFRISSCEITNDQYCEFLNAVAKEDTYALYNSGMASQVVGGIKRLGNSGYYVYDVKPFMGNKPVNFVNYWDACRFCNWLHNGRPTGDQDASTTEDGAYDLTDGLLYVTGYVSREDDAKYFIPSENEWYKAAYHDPRSQANGGPIGVTRYWGFSYRNTSEPNSVHADGAGNIDSDDGNSANYGNSTTWNAIEGNVTTVGSAKFSHSYYGLYDMGGNVSEWVDTGLGLARAIRGGSYASLSKSDLSRNEDRAENLNTHYIDTGFRIAAPR